VEMFVLCVAGLKKETLVVRLIGLVRNPNCARGRANYPTAEISRRTWPACTERACGVRAAAASLWKAAFEP
jgi:hypothetical protein